MNVEPQSLTKSLCKTVVAKFGKACKLSDRTVDSITEDFLTNESFIETSNETIETIVMNTPKITFTIASAVVFGYFAQKVYTAISDFIATCQEDSEEEEDSGVEYEPADDEMNEQVYL